jgi:hypothetical protein
MDENFNYIQKLSYEMFRLPNGNIRYIDNVRFGGNGLLAWDRSKGKCEICGTMEKLCLHHKNKFSNDLDDLIVVCRKCHRKIEEENKRNGKI